MWGNNTVTNATLFLCFCVMLLLFILSGCATPRAYRVRMDAIRTSAIIFEREEHASWLCIRRMLQQARQTGRPARQDSGALIDEHSRVRGCLLVPRREGAYWRIISSLETIDNFIHELCHRFSKDRTLCDGIHLDRGEKPGRTIRVPLDIERLLQ